MVALTMFDDAHRLNLRVTLTSATDVNECVAFTLDQPFAGRRLLPLTAECPRPRAGTSTVSLKFEKLTDDDLQFPSHTLVWACRAAVAALELFGVCVVEHAGTADFHLPSRTVLPIFGQIGSFVPFFSFGPP
jgi:hypothetical protein